MGDETVFRIQIFHDFVHGQVGALRIGQTGENAPGLGDQMDFVAGVFMGAVFLPLRREGADEPFSVPQQVQLAFAMGIDLFHVRLPVA